MIYLLLISAHKIDKLHSIYTEILVKGTHSVWKWTSIVTMGNNKFIILDCHQPDTFSKSKKWPFDLCQNIKSWPWCWTLAWTIIKSETFVLVSLLDICVIYYYDSFDSFIKGYHCFMGEHALISFQFSFSFTWVLIPVFSR